MARVDLVGGLLHGSTVGLTLEGHRAVATADLVFLPGDWSGEPIRALAAERLREGRLLTAADILEAAADVEHLVVLFSGAPPIATGRGAEFPSAQRLRELLSREGHEVQVIGGVSSIQAAALEAGLDLCTAEAPVLVVISAESPPTALPALRRAAATDAVLAVLWFEDHAPDLVGELASVRGASARAVLVRDLGLAPTAWDATLAAVLAGAKELRPPAVLFSFSAPDSLPVDFLDSVREWCAGLAPGLSWLIGPPGSGKTTWLRGVEQVAGDIHAVELGRLVSGLWAGPDRRQGAMKALDLAAAAVRSIDRKPSTCCSRSRTTGWRSSEGVPTRAGGEPVPPNFGLRGTLRASLPRCRERTSSVPLTAELCSGGSTMRTAARRPDYTAGTNREQEEQARNGAGGT